MRVESPNPLVMRALQKAIGGVECEIRVAKQYMFEAGPRGGDPKYRDLLLNAAAEELGHIEMLAITVALNLEGAPPSLQDAEAGDPAVGAILGGMNLRHLRSTGSPRRRRIRTACRSTRATSTLRASTPPT